MKIVESFAKKNRCYTNGTKISVKGLMLHSVGCPQPKATVFVNNWNNSTAGTCVHAVLGEDGTVYQLLPWNVKAWHCGSGSRGSGNNTHIGVEMTEPATIQYTGGSGFTDKNPTQTKQFVQATYKHAVELFAYLCKQYGLNPLQDGVIISHSEGHKRGIASNHGDVEHIWNKFGLSMDQFRNDVKAAMSGAGAAGGTNIPPQAENAGNGANTKPYTVKITASVLNVRKGPGTKYGVATQVKRNEVYTIVGEEMNGTTKWGKLKSGAGYISLAYTQRN